MLPVMNTGMKPIQPHFSKNNVVPYGYQQFVPGVNGIYTHATSDGRRTLVLDSAVFNGIAFVDFEKKEPAEGSVAYSGPITRMVLADGHPDCPEETYPGCKDPYLMLFKSNGTVKQVFGQGSGNPISGKFWNPDIEQTKKNQTASRLLLYA